MRCTANKIDEYVERLRIEGLKAVYRNKKYSVYKENCFCLCKNVTAKECVLFLKGMWATRVLLRKDGK